MAAAPSSLMETPEETVAFFRYSINFKTGSKTPRHLFAP
jgi:hypothetical protein